jgi:hypothetical protein
MIKDGQLSFDITEQEAGALDKLMHLITAKGGFTEEERHEIADELTETALIHHQTGYFQGLRDALEPESRAQLERALKEYENRNGGSRPS